MNIKTKTMTTMLLILFFLSLLLKAELVQNTSAQLADMEKTIQEMMEKGDIPGLSIVMIKGDNQVLIKNLGYADQEKEVPVTSDTIFELGSCSKSFTALATLQLAEQKLINLDDPVSKYFPGFFVKYQGQQYQLTIRQLLYHTGGIPWSTISLIPKGNDQDALEQTVKQITGIELNHIPGQQFEYATVNYDIVGAIIEKVTQKSFEDYMDQDILKPLGLNDTFVGVVPHPAHKAKGYKIGFFSPRAYTPPVYRGNNPAAYVSCSANDLARWLQIQMGSVETGFTPLIRKTQRHNRLLAPGTPSLSSYAMGWFVSLVGEKQIYHGGLNPDFTAYVGFQPGKKIGAAVLANSNSTYTPYIGNYILRTKTYYVTINIYDAAFKKKIELYRTEMVVQFGKDIDPFDAMGPLPYVYDNNVFIKGKGDIHVFDSSGQKQCSIIHKYDKIKVTEQDMENIHAFYKTNPMTKQFYYVIKDRIKFPDYFPDIRWYNVANQKVYVLTNKRSEGKSEFVIFDIKGKFLKKIMLPFGERDKFLFSPYTIKNDTLYQLIENDDTEEWELHITEIN